jgi:hypothetical protein
MRDFIRLKSIILIICLFCLAITSCAPVRPNLGPPVSQEFARELLQTWQDQATQITSVKGLAKVEVRAPLNDINGSQVVLAQLPDRLRAETLTPFGVPVLTLAVSGDQLGVHLSAQNLYYLGNASSENLGQFVNIPLNPEDLVRVLLYQPALIKAWKEEAFTLKDGGWLLIRSGAIQRQELVYNAERELVEVAYFVGNDLKLRVNYAQLSDDHRPYPARISLDLPEKHATVDLEFTDYETNGSIRDGLFTLTPSAGAKVVYLPN